MDIAPLIRLFYDCHHLDISTSNSFMCFCWVLIILLFPKCQIPSHHHLVVRLQQNCSQIINTLHDTTTYRCGHFLGLPSWETSKSARAHMKFRLLGRVGNNTKRIICWLGCGIRRGIRREWAGSGFRSGRSSRSGSGNWCGNWSCRSCRRRGCWSISGSTGWAERRGINLECSRSLRIKLGKIFIYFNGNFGPELLNMSVGNNLDILEWKGSGIHESIVMVVNRKSGDTFIKVGRSRYGCFIGTYGAFKIFGQGRWKKIIQHIQEASRNERDANVDIDNAGCKSGQ